MYMLSNWINGKTVRTVNYRHFHGVFLNWEETLGPRQPGAAVIPIECIYNMFDCPRLTILTTRLMLPQSIVATFPTSSYYEFIPVAVKKFVSTEYCGEFDFMYKSRKYANDPDGFINALVTNSPEPNPPFADAPCELLTFWEHQIEYATAVMTTYRAAEGHQAKEMERSISLRSGLVEACGIFRVDSGFVFRDDLFDTIRPFLRDDYFRWQQYVAE